MKRRLKKRTSLVDRAVSALSAADLKRLQTEMARHTRLCAELEHSRASLALLNVELRERYGLDDSHGIDMKTGAIAVAPKGS